MNKLAIYILTKDRYDFAIQCIKSAILNTNADVIVSDCSTNNFLLERINIIKSKTNCKIYYKFRERPIEQFEHISLIIKENNYEYFTIFHDDDILHPDYSLKMLKIHESGDYIAVGCNFNLIDVNNMKLKQNTIYFSSRKIGLKRLLNSYCKFSFLRHPCFSGYMYKKDNLVNIFPSINDGGTWSDLAFILRLTDFGNIAWCKDELMSYRIHSNNLSKKEKIIDRVKITNFLKKKFHLKKYSSFIIQYKLKYLIKFLNRKKFHFIYIKLLFFAIFKNPLIIFKLIYLSFSKKLNDQNWIS
jgi:hypothetical protein